MGTNDNRLELILSTGWTDEAQIGDDDEEKGRWEIPVSAVKCWQMWQQSLEPTNKATESKAQKSNWSMLVFVGE